jgi:hypothetical protein
MPPVIYIVLPVMERVFPGRNGPPGPPVGGRPLSAQARPPAGGHGHGHSRPFCVGRPAECLRSPAYILPVLTTCARCKRPAFYKPAAASSLPVTPTLAVNHLEFCHGTLAPASGQDSESDQAKSYVLRVVCTVTSTYWSRYILVHDSTRISIQYMAVHTGTSTSRYQYVLLKA